MATSRSNSVEIKCSDITSISYIKDSLVITEGQPSTPPATISQKGDKWTITMECGRKGNSSVAGQFENMCGGKAHAFSPEAYSDPTPSNLNFYFGVTVTFKTPTGTRDLNLILAQGHQTLANNWWIGGNCIASKSNKTILAVLNQSTGNTDQVYSVTGSTSSFTLTQWIK